VIAASPASVSTPVNSAWPLFQVVVTKKNGRQKNRLSLVDQLGRVAQQARRYFPAEAALEALGEQVFQHQPDPADQHDDGHGAGEAGAVAVHHDETEDTGAEAEQGDQARVALQQAEDESDEALHALFPDQHGAGYDETKGGGIVTPDVGGRHGE
jgi:hypothetical protein